MCSDRGGIAENEGRERARGQQDEGTMIADEGRLMAREGQEMSRARESQDNRTTGRVRAEITSCFTSYRNTQSIAVPISHYIMHSIMCSIMA